MSDDQAYSAFRAVRFADNAGEPFCPHCGCDAVYEYAARRIFKCKACEKQFSLTSGTIFSNRKLAMRDILAAIAIFVNGANGVAALRLSREIGCTYKTAFVLAHKLREVLGTLRTPDKLTGIVEIDGVWVGGHIKPKNKIEEREDRRLAHMRKSDKRRSVVTLRERRPGGRTLTTVLQSEAEGVEFVLANTDESAAIHADEGSHWDVLMAYRDLQQVNHSLRYVDGKTHTNNVESFNSRVRRAERGVHHRISGRHLQGYADEFAWREDYRRVSNGQQFAAVMRGATRAGVSREWKGYWQRRAGDDPGENRTTMRLPG